MNINGFEFAGFKRILRESNCEYWRCVFVDGKGATTEDALMIVWERDVIKAVLFVSCKQREKSALYYDLILGLFHNLATFHFKVVFQEFPDNYSFEEQRDLFMSLFS